MARLPGRSTLPRNTSNDAPFLDCAYKLVEYAGHPCRKRSSGKQYWPAAKQVFRRHGEEGALQGDTLAPRAETLPGKAMLESIIRSGTVLASLPSLTQVRAPAASQIAALPVALRSLSREPPFPVHVSDTLRDLARQVDTRQGALAQLDHARWAST